MHKLLKVIEDKNEKGKKNIRETARTTAIFK
jgi:hypothetical protein